MGLDESWKGGIETRWSCQNGQPQLSPRLWVHCQLEWRLRQAAAVADGELPEGGRGGGRKEMGAEVVAIKPRPAISFSCFWTQRSHSEAISTRSHEYMLVCGDLQNGSSHLTHMRQGVFVLWRWHDVVSNELCVCRSQFYSIRFSRCSIYGR